MPPFFKHSKSLFVGIHFRFLSPFLLLLVLFRFFFCFFFFFDHFNIFSICGPFKIFNWFYFFHFFFFFFFFFLLLLLLLLLLFVVPNFWLCYPTKILPLHPISLRNNIWGVRDVMVIVEGNGHDNTSSNPARDWLHFT